MDKRRLELASTVNVPILAGTTPAFLLKLRNLLDDPDNDHLICWDDEGRSFHLHDQTKFAKEVLPQYFKHNNLASFIRQLNMYGFKKVSTIEHGGLNSKDDMEFENQYFVRNDPTLMELIKRKNARSERTISGSVIREKLSEYGALQPAQVGDVLHDVKDLKDTQLTMSNRLDRMKLENRALWREVVALRHKHTQQQNIINKLIQFMMTMAGGSSRPMKRTLPMIEIGPASKRKPEPPTYGAAAYSSLLDDQTQNNTLSASGNSIGSSATNGGVVIQDVTDSDVIDAGYYEPTILLDGEVDELNIPVTITDDEPPNTNVVVSRSTTPSVINPSLFKTQLSENVQEIQSDLDILKDLFSNSDALALSSDALENIFDGNGADVLYSFPSNPQIDLNDLVQSTGSTSTDLMNSGDQITSSDLQTPTLSLEGIMSDMNTPTLLEDGAIHHSTLGELVYPLDSDDENDISKPIISSHDLD